MGHYYKLQDISNIILFIDWPCKVRFSWYIFYAINCRAENFFEILRIFCTVPRKPYTAN